MATTTKRFNPFYFLLVIAGAAFAVTAFAYGLMAYQVMSAGPVGVAEHPLWRLLRSHGNGLLMGQAAAVALLSVAAMTTDRWWARHAAAPADQGETKRL